MTNLPAIATGLGALALLAAGIALSLANGGQFLDPAVVATW